MLQKRLRYQRIFFSEALKITDNEGLIYKCRIGPAKKNRDGVFAQMIAVCSPISTPVTMLGAEIYKDDELQPIGGVSFFEDVRIFQYEKGNIKWKPNGLIGFVLNNNEGVNIEREVNFGILPYQNMINSADELKQKMPKIKIDPFLYVEKYLNL